MLRPAADLTLAIAAGTPEIAETDGGIVDFVQSRQDICHIVVNLGPFGRPEFRQVNAAEDAAVLELHDIEHLADDAFVLAKRIGFRDWYARTVKRRDDLELAVDRMRGGQKFARRLLAQDIALAGTIGDHEGRIGHAAAELAELERGREAFDMVAHVIFQRGRIEPVGFLNRDRLIGRCDCCNFFHDETQYRALAEERNSRICGVRLHPRAGR